MKQLLRRLTVASVLTGLFFTHTAFALTTLQNNVPLTNLSAAWHVQKMYQLVVPAGAANLRFVTQGGSGDADIYMKKGTQPTLTSYDLRSISGTNSETITVSAPTAGTYYLLVYAYAAYSGMSLVGAYDMVPTLSLTASSSSIVIGQSSTLSWSSTNATTCSASGAWSGTKATSGSLSVSPTTTATYTLACSGAGGTTTQSAVVTVGAALKYFGYAVVDCGWDDPLDGVVKTNYATETSAFSNMGQLCVYNPTDNIVSRLQLMSANGMKAFLAVEGIFFAGTPDPTTGSGMRFTLWPDYLARWNAFVANNSGADLSAIAAFYIADEPVWNGISASELKTVTDLLKTAFPTIPTAVVEAFPVIDQLQVPTSMDWIGFDLYGIQDPEHDPTYLNYLAHLKARMSTSSQKVLIVMDAKWTPAYSYSSTTLAQVATSYYNLAKSDPTVIGMWGYIWPGGLDGPTQLGTRELPQNVRDEHSRIGKLITGK